MTDGGRTCTECDNPVAGRALTCSATCRSRRSRRQRETLASGRDVPTLVTDELERAAQAEFQEQLKPVIKEAITEDVLDAIHDMIGLLPSAIAAIRDDLTSDDKDLRQRAYTQLLRHTAGSKSIVPDVNADKQRDVNVTFGVPRPEDLDRATDSQGQEVIQTKECDTCHTAKPLSEFVANSDRCETCFGEMREQAKALLGESAIEQP